MLRKLNWLTEPFRRIRTATCVMCALYVCVGAAERDGTFFVNVFAWINNGMARVVNVFAWIITEWLSLCIQLFV